jgi:transcriptional regulator of arginine metabolism
MYIYTLVMYFYAACRRNKLALESTVLIWQKIDGKLDEKSPAIIEWQHLQFYSQSRRTYGPMKQQRHTAIREVLNHSSVPSQDELRRRLARRGFHVTQATLSRDIHELRLSKGPVGYSLPNAPVEEDDDSLPGIREVLGSFGLEVRQAMNQLVLITTTGSAQPVAAGIDYEDWPEVVGTIAGDDTVLIICPDERQARTLKVRIEEFIG